MFAYICKRRCRSRQIFGGVKKFCPNFPKLARNGLCAFCPHIFSHKDHEDLFLVRPSKSGHNVFFCNRWAPFFKVKLRWWSFLSWFSGILPEFSEDLAEFSRILPKLLINQNICECACTPASPPPIPLFVSSHKSNMYITSQMCMIKISFFWNEKLVVELPDWFLFIKFKYESAVVNNFN